MHRINLLLKSLVLAGLALSLTCIPLHADSCFTPCGSASTENVQHCILSGLDPLVPELPAPTCCANEHLQGEQYVSGRTKPKERKAPSWQTAIAPQLSDKTRPQLPVSSKSDSQQFFAEAASRPLHILHASLLV